MLATVPSSLQWLTVVVILASALCATLRAWAGVAEDPLLINLFDII